MKTGLIDNKESIDERLERVKLTRDEYMYAICAGIRNAEAYDSTPIGKNDIRTNCEGSVGEMIVCKYFGVGFENGKSDEYSIDVDAVIDGVSVDIKADARNFHNPKLLVKKGLVENGESKIYILVRLNVEDDGIIPGWGDIVGYGYSDQIQEFKAYRHPKHIVNYILDWEVTDPISELDYMRNDEPEPLVESASSDIINYIEIEWLKEDKEDEI